MRLADTQQEVAENISARIAQLPSKSRAELVKLWDETFSDPPPAKLRKELMVPILAYRIQELAFGGLSNSARKRLAELVGANRGRRPSKRSVDEPVASCAKLIRSWQGEVHEVLIIEDGYLYRGEHFQKLSPIAKRITGTQWSGPAFFGTKPKDGRR